MRKFLATAVCALFVLTASAQRASSSSSSFFSTEKSDEGVTFGIRAGMNLATFTGDVEDAKSRVGFHVGVIADIPLMQSLYIQPGIYVSQKGAKWEESDDDYKYKETMNPLYIEIPILASYRYNFGGGSQLQVNFGPYFAYGIGGKVKIEESEYDYNDDVWYIYKSEGDFFGDKGADFKRFDFGLQVGAGFTFATHYNISLGYQFGLTKFNDGNSSIKNGNFLISLGYNF